MQKLLKKYRSRYEGDCREDDIRNMVAAKIIQNYSYAAAFSGGATALTGVVPGLGQLIAAFGGVTADIALSMKFQVEMFMALASLYDHDIELDEERMLCFIIAGLGFVSKAAQKGATGLGTKAFIKLVRKHLSGATLATVKAVFRKIGVTFTRKAAEKAIPFGVGVVIGFSANKGVTWYIAENAHDYFKSN